MDEYDLIDDEDDFDDLQQDITRRIIGFAGRTNDEDLRHDIVAQVMAAIREFPDDQHGLIETIEIEDVKVDAGSISMNCFIKYKI